MTLPPSNLSPGPKTEPGGLEGGQEHYCGEVAPTPSMAPKPSPRVTDSPPSTEGHPLD